MKMFKKFFVLVCSIMMVLATATTAFAAEQYTAEEKALYEKVAAGVVVNGSTVVLPEGYLTQFQAYLMRTDLTSAQVAAMSAKTDEILALVKSEGKTSFENIAKDRELVLQIIDMVDSVNKSQNLNVTITPYSDMVVIKDAAGNVIFQATAPASSTVNPSGTPHTGSSNMGLAYVGVIAAVVLAGSAIVMKKKAVNFAQ